MITYARQTPEERSEIATPPAEDHIAPAPRVSVQAFCDTVETAADYEYVRIGGGTQQFLLPVHSESLSCQRGTSNCSRNTIDFRNYKKYSGEASITFDK